MQAIEFETTIDNGKINIPEIFHFKESDHIKVIILYENNHQQNTSIGIIDK